MMQKGEALERRFRNADVRVGVLIRQARLERDMTLDQLSTRLGISSMYLSDVERGKRRLTYDLAFHLWLHVDFDRDQALLMLGSVPEYLNTGEISADQAEQITLAIRNILDQES